MENDKTATGEQSGPWSPPDLFKDLEGRRRAARERAQAAEEKLKLERMTREVEREELEAKKAELEIEYNATVGPRGEKWDFVPSFSTRQVVAVKQPHPLVWQQHRDAGMRQSTEGYSEILYGKGEACALLGIGVTEFQAMVMEEPGLLDMAALISIRLASAANEGIGKK